MSYVTLELTALPPQDVDDQIAAVKALAEADPNVQITIEFTGQEFLSLFEASAATVDKPKPAAKSKPAKAAVEVEEDEEDDAGDDEPSKSTRFRRTKEETAADLSVEQAKAFRKSKLSIEEFLAEQDGDDDEDDDTASATDEDDTDEDEDDADVEVDEDESDEEEASEEEDEPTVTPAQVVELAKKAVGYPGLTSDERRPHLSRILKKLKVDRFSNIPSDKLEEGVTELNAVLKKFKKLVEDKKS